MLKNLKNSRVGKYYSAICAKYGNIAPIVVAVVAFVLTFAIDCFDVMETLKDASLAAYIVTLALFGVGLLLTLFYMCAKLSSSRINAADFILFVMGLLLVFDLIRLILFSNSILFVILFIVALVIVIALTIVRVAVAKFSLPAEYEVKSPNTSIKSYFRALNKKSNLVVLALGGVAVFTVAYLFSGVEFNGGNEWTYVTIAALVIMAAAILFNIPGRLASKRMEQIDGVVASMLIASILYAIPVFMSFETVQFVIWLVVLLVFALFMVLMIKKTHLEEEQPAKECEQSGKKGFKVYFKLMAKKYNLIISAMLSLIAFISMYAIIAMDLFHAVETVVEGGIYVALMVLVFGFFVAQFMSARKREVGANDILLYAMCIFSLLAIVPAVQFFSLMNIICLGLLLVLECVVLALRIARVHDAETEGNEVYSPKAVFGKENMSFLSAAVNQFFKGKEGDSHYISNRESRRIAKDNMRITKQYEKEKKRRNVPESEYVTQMKDDKNIVEFEDLHTYFFSDSGVVKAVNGVTFSIPQGSTVGVIGESGCGKSVTSLSLMQLVQAPKGQVMHGSKIRFKSTVYKEDENGQRIPVYEVQEDENGNQLLDENGDPVYVTAPKLDKKGNQLKDKDGNPIIEKVQKCDLNGIPLFETEEKVYDVAKMPTEVMRNIRGREITMIFQEPMTSLNPIFTIGNQLNEVVFLHVPGATKETAKARTFEMLKMVGIIPENVYDRYPHELSGGMRQRVMIAMALLCHPKLIIADEPTTALDVTIQAQILDLLRDIKKQINGSIMFITHDLGVIAEMADYVVVMYAGRVIEMGTAKEIFDNPMHPYTMGLQKSKPAVNKKVDRLYSIPGSVPNPINMPDYCYFRDRCDKRCDKCGGNYPDMIEVTPTHKVSCHLYEKED